MQEFIRLLKQRYLAVAAAQSVDGGSGHQEYLEQLCLAEAVIGKGRLIHDMPEHALQIAVIGPTQAGKSSVVNLLLHSGIAGVSPLAGYTVHPQGFCCGVAEAHLTWLGPFFGDFRQVKQQELRRDHYHMFSLTPDVAAHDNHLPPCVLWDTPDFDSIDAAGYREGVLKTIALADAIVLVVSKEKYADQSVWDVMTLLQPLKQPTMIVVNKLAEESQQTVLKSLQEKWRQARQDVFPEVLPLLYRPQGVATADAEQAARKKLAKILHNINRRKHSGHEQQYLIQHWSQWIKPVLAEHAAHAEWRQLVEQAVNDGLSRYQRDFLDHPYYYETFQNALAELLTLLELPGIARILAGTRRVLTWPVKKIWRFGASKRGAALTDTSHELSLLQQIAEHQLIQLADKLLDKVEQGGEQRQWWKVLGLSLRRRRGEILREFGTGGAAYHGDFQQHVETAALSLYHKLQEQPLVLNSLRATRISTDAAAVALALHTGGIGLHDLVIAPAMLSVTSLLAESAIGGYMHKVEAELKQTQLATVKRQLFERYFQALLEQLPETLNETALFNISEAQLAGAEHYLKEKKHGLRILGFT